MSFTIIAAGQVCKQTISFVCLGGVTSADRWLNIDITKFLQGHWSGLQRYSMIIYDRPDVRLRLKGATLKG